MAVLKIKDTDGTWQAQGNVGVFGSSCEEIWTQLVDIELEENTQMVDQTWPLIPMKKIRVLIETPAASSNTNYMPVTIATQTEMLNIFNFYNAGFYPTPLPQTSKCNYEYLIEVIKLGDDAFIKFTESKGGIRGLITNETQRIFLLDEVKSAMSDGCSIYNKKMYDQITGIRFQTYSEFSAGTKLKIWGLAK